MVQFFLEQGKEGECWDFKQEWHEKMSDLIKDIICFANTVHDENCYLIFGVSDDLQIKGMQKERVKQAHIIDAISNLVFAGDIYPKIEVQTLVMEEHEIDVLIIFNVENTPIFLKKQYGSMRAGCIYTRVGDKNTPDNGNADVMDIENLWKKRLGLTKPPLEYIYDRMHNKLEWTENDESFYNIYRPEYTIEVIRDPDDDSDAEFYAYAMTNNHTSYRELNIKYQQTTLESYQLVVLDGGRLTIPTPEWGFVCHDQYGLSPKYSYKYYVLGSKRYRLLSFLYDSQNGDARFAFHHLLDVVLIFHDEEEKIAFEVYMESHQELLEERLSSIQRYSHISTGEHTKTELYQERLRTGVALNIILEEWRKRNL